MKTCWAKVKDYILACISVFLLYVLATIWIPDEWCLRSSVILGVLLWFTLIITYSYKRTKSSFSLLTLLDVAMLVLFGALIALVVAVTMGKISINDDNSTAYVIITFTLTMGALIPYLISRSIAQSEINKLVDEKVEILFKQKIEDLEEVNNTSLYNLTKQSAHTARMMAHMLENNHEPEWAIGWASQSLIRYMQINYKPKSNFYKDCLRIIMNATPNNDKELTAEQQNRLNRSLIDLFDMYLLYNSDTNCLFMEESKTKIVKLLNMYSKELSLETLFFNSKFFEYSSKKFKDKISQKEYFTHLIQSDSTILYKRTE